MPRVPGSPSSEGESPAEVVEYADQAVQYVHRALGMTLEYDSETLPVLDHYLRSVPAENAAAAHLVAATAGAYFGEVVKRRMGGAWDLPTRDPGSWRLVLPTGLWFSPAAIALAVIVGADEDGNHGDEATDPEADSIAGSDWMRRSMRRPRCARWSPRSSTTWQTCRTTSTTRCADGSTPSSTFKRCSPASPRRVAAETSRARED